MNNIFCLKFGQRPITHGRSLETTPNNIALCPPTTSRKISATITKLFHLIYPNPIPINPPSQSQHNHLQNHKRNKQHHDIIFRWRAEHIVGVGENEKAGHDPQSPGTLCGDGFRAFCININAAEKDNTFQ